MQVQLTALPAPKDTARVSDSISAPDERVENGSSAAESVQRERKKQRRNKPTLSCLECVERKTKCDRSRPVCLACVKRQSHCNYSAVANLIAASDRKGGANGHKAARYVTKPPAKLTQTSAISPTTASASPSVTDSGWNALDNRTAHPPQPSRTTSPFLFSNMPYSQSSPSNVFGIGSQHPFANYWTCQGGLPEVVSVLPSKEQADMLISKYFETVDPVYPFIHRRTFYSDYELFWSLSAEERGTADASLVALHYAMYALGTQFMQFPQYEERSQTAEFYCSAANQALRVYSYLNRTSMRAIQAMLLMTYFLMNDNHASDGYAWAGIHSRQAYAMRLHRDPELVVPEASILEKQQRRKLWQAVFVQDTFLTMILKLPPSATHSDVSVESLSNENELNDDGVDICLGSHSRVENLMSINVIAPQISRPLPPPQPHHFLAPGMANSDIAYMRGMWHLGNLVQENLASPFSLSLPVVHSPRHKEGLVAAFKRLYKSLSPHLTISDPTVLQRQDLRLVRQNLFLNSDYYHALALLQASENSSQGVSPNISAALEAAHDAVGAFFKLWGLLEVEAGAWWGFQHRAFEDALLIAKLLALDDGEVDQADEIHIKAKQDVSRMLEIMERYGGAVEIHKTRKEALHKAFERIMR